VAAARGVADGLSSDRLSPLVPRFSTGPTAWGHRRRRRTAVSLRDCSPLDSFCLGLTRATPKTKPRLLHFGISFVDRFFQCSPQVNLRTESLGAATSEVLMALPARGSRQSVPTYLS